MTTIYDELRALTRTLMRRKRYSRQGDLAAALDVSQQTVSRWLWGQGTSNTLNPDATARLVQILRHEKLMSKTILTEMKRKGVLK